MSACDRASGRRRLAIAAIAAIALAGCPQGNAPANPDESAGDVHVKDARPVHANAGGYDYVAERPLAVVALAEARNIDAQAARAAIDHLADRLDVCATEQGRAGKLTTGAGRIVAIIGKVGAVSATKVTVDADDGGAGTAVLCFVAPTKELAFAPAATDEQRGLAIEAMWGTALPHGNKRK